MRSDPRFNSQQPPLVVHLIHRLAVGGLENGLVNLVNHMPAGRYRHAIVCLTDMTDFRGRIARSDVPVFALEHRSRPGGLHVRAWRLFRQLRPAIVHTRNLAGLEYLAVAALAGVRGRVHGEHGRDIYDLDGLSPKYRLFRRAMRPLVHRYIGVSKDLATWLVDTIGVRPDRVAQVYNGVDSTRFAPRCGPRPELVPGPFAAAGTVLIGTVGRMHPVKDPLTLVRAFVRLLDTQPGLRETLRLVMVGDGPLRGEAQQLLRAGNAEQLAWLPGERRDVPHVMRALDVFVLPSLREGTSNTILEAMACGLPVVATGVGGNTELVCDGETGTLVPPADAVAMAAALRGYVADPGRARQHGAAGRARVEKDFSMEAMIGAYADIYDSVLQSTTPLPAGSRPPRPLVGSRTER
jgi:sugar transferase (PEP-CTERM/EpsH1 system associated)